MPDIDYQAVFRATPGPVVLLSPEDFRVLDANDKYLSAVERRHREVLGQNIFSIFPGHQEPPGEGPERVRESLESVCETCESDWIHMVRYDLEKPDEPGVFEERYWNMVSAPILGPDGRPVIIIHLIEDATPQVRAAQTDHAVAG